MKKALKILALVLVVLLVVAAGGYTWASVASSRTLARTFETHRVDFPIPFPLTMEEIAADSVAPEDVERVAMERAVERGRHLVEARYVCGECHGQNFGGGVMIDAFPIGTILGPNLTTGAGSATLDFGPADWDRIVRHGVLSDGRPAVMPSEDFEFMSDQELSDIVAFIRSHPAVDNQVAPRVFGPLGKVLVATGQIQLTADMLASHAEPHVQAPPVADATVEFGRHLAATCRGCHAADFAGGPIAGGDPSWAPAANLTPHPAALGSWDLEDFDRAMREGIGPDGVALLTPMSLVVPYGRNMTDVELEAIWLYLRSIPPVAPVQ